MDSKSMERLLNVEEASKFLGLHPKTFRKEVINKGLMPVVCLGKGARGDRIRPSDLESYIGERTCYIKGEKRGGQSSGIKAQGIIDPLGQPIRRKHKKQNPGLKERQLVR